MCFALASQTRAGAHWRADTVAAGGRDGEMLAESIGTGNKLGTGPGPALRRRGMLQVGHNPPVRAMAMVAVGGVLGAAIACSPPRMPTSATAVAAAPPPASAPVDPARIPVGDGKLVTANPRPGYLLVCAIPTSTNPPGRAPWIGSDGTWDSTAKVAVQGSVAWPSQFNVSLLGALVAIAGNGLPSHVTGVFPIARGSDPAAQYDGNPNTIRVNPINWDLPANPQVNTTPTCTTLGAIGVLLSGARLYNASDADGRDAVAHEVQDACDGHPQNAGQYHYHNVSRCLSDARLPTGHSALVGYAADGFGVYGNRGVGGVSLTNADLDECHGHAHDVTADGVTATRYHYHATREFPYTVGCFRGTPVPIR